jgi:hypothetical protein
VKKQKTGESPLSADSAAYRASGAEMERRRRAYTTLVVSLFAGVAVSSLDYVHSAPAIASLFLAGLAFLLFLSWVVFLASFRRFADTLLLLDDSQLRRTRATSRETYRFEDIVGYRVKRTTRGSIREVTLRLRSGQRVGLNAVDDFERFEQELRPRVPANAARSEVREAIDFDHPLFYVIFGALTGLALTTTVRAMATLNKHGLRWAHLGIAGYAVILGVYFLLGRPIAQRYGPKSRVADLILGSLAVLAGILLAVRSLAPSGSDGQLSS